MPRTSNWASQYAPACCSKNVPAPPVEAGLEMLSCFEPAVSAIGGLDLPCLIPCSSATLSEKTRIDRVLAHLNHFELSGLRMPRIQQNIERLRDHGRWHAQQGGTPGLQPTISYCTRPIRLFDPVRRKIGRQQVLNDKGIGRAKREQAVARRQIAHVDLKMHQDLQQRRSRTLTTVNNSTTACVPAARRSHPAIAGQRNVVTDSP